ncbi:MAG: hypothetical protein ABJB47_12050 [Actinomycetota bacterium]
MRILKQLVIAAALAAAILPALPVAVVSAASSGGCHAERTPTGWVVVCSGDTSSPGGGGGAPGAGGGGGDTCTLSSLPPGYPFPSPAPKGEKWMWITCQVVEQTGLVLVPTGSTTGTPGVTPQQLEQWALADLHVPVPAPMTAPPRGSGALVGLPEWFWMRPGDWHPVSARVSVGPVWAQVTAVPATITISPGAGLPAATCTGPGTAYNKARPASAQHTNCSVIYPRSSDQQPRNLYQAAVTVTWTASWTGSGGTGGPITPALHETTRFGIRVAEGQALVTGTGP